MQSHKWKTRIKIKKIAEEFEEVKKLVYKIKIT